MGGVRDKVVSNFLVELSLNNLGRIVGENTCVFGVQPDVFIV